MTGADKSNSDKDTTLQYFDLDGSASLGRPIDVPVKGSIPAWVKGSLYRNGSGVYKMGDLTWKHAFDGFAVLHRWTIKDGRVTYLSSVLDSDHYNKCVKVNRLTGYSFGSSFPDPCKNIFSSILQESSLIIGNQILQVSIANYIAVHMGTAHPHQDPDGTMYYFGTNIKYSQAYNFVRIPRNPQAQSPFAGAELIGFIPSRWKLNVAYTHSFGMTKNYFVHIEQPYVISVPKIATMAMRHSSLADCIRCYPEEP
ncbi:unnamed protein product, partial [Candidula unifasciata]